MPDKSYIVSFLADIEEFAKRTRQAPGLIAKVVAQKLFGAIVTDTPVDTGRARASWAVSLGTPSDYVPPAIKRKRSSKKKNDGSASEPLPEFPKPEFPDFEPNNEEPIFIISNLPYIQALEDGHSKQAPNGMVKRNVAKLSMRLQLGLDL